jgi:hypothetical protein
MDRFNTLLEWLTFLDLLIKESRNVALGQKVNKFFTGVHGVSHKHRCRQVIARYLHVLNLMTHGTEESITEESITEAVGNGTFRYAGRLSLRPDGSQ